MGRIGKLIKNFGLGFTIKAGLCKAVEIVSIYNIPLYKRHMAKFCEKEFGEIAKKYANRSAPKFSEGKIPAYVMWWQGYDSAPPLIKCCIASQRRALPKDKFSYHIITKDNLSEFVTLPEAVRKKAEKGQISLTHLSDIVRMYLLKEHGGLWLDATIYLSSEFDKEFYSSDFYATKRTPARIKRFITSGRWSGFFMKGAPDFPLFAFCAEAFSKYWEKYDCLLDYFLIDYTINAAYEFIPTVRAAIDAVPMNNERKFELNSRLNEKYESEALKALFSECNLHKLNRRVKLKEKTKDGEPTVWHELLVNGVL